MSKMKDFFKPEDFIAPYGYAGLNRMEADLAANAANEKLNKLMKSWPIVYGHGETPGASSLWNMNGPEKERAPHTHKARLAFIQELPKEPCKHEPVNTIFTDRHKIDLENEIAFNRQPSKSHCKHCGVELQATWSEKK